MIGGVSIKNKKLRKRLLFLSISLMLITTYIKNYKYSDNYEILEEDDDSLAFGKYSDGYIYIGDKDFLSDISTLDGDILVEDQRNSKNPDMVIYDSYKVTDKDSRNEILEVLCEYEKCYPSPWDRSIESMRCEWFIHNLSHVFNYKKSHSDDVDLDNKDEEKYKTKVLYKIIRF